MMPERGVLAGALLMSMLLLDGVSACGRGNTATPNAPASPSVANTTQSPSAAPTTAEPSQVPTPVPSTVPAGWTVVSSRVAYQWKWPNWDGAATVIHSYPVPPVPQLVAIGAGDHPNDPGERPYNRLSFTFTTAFPSYQVQFVRQVVSDPKGEPVPLEGLDALQIIFKQAQAHTVDGTRSTIVSQPPRHLGMKMMASYAQAGDFEGVLTYGIGVNRPVAHSNPQVAVRAYEVKMVNQRGDYRYVVAIDVDAG